jgi:hypothetical protein
MPPRNVVPNRGETASSVWVACSRRDTILLAAQRASAR